ncbi:MAG: hypothetical protein MUF05_04980 [Candidatus Omnitrophica bacterium]|jgi:hypothetical protein|nr:hypothetical protein [Candidatus Omnitrophota bacterium]
MNVSKPKFLDKLDQKMQEIEPGSVRYHVLETARNFKVSWVELGRSLYSVWKDKLYKQWGYSEFEFYTAKEVGVRKETAVKLLKSYYFLEKEEPAYLEQGSSTVQKAAKIPSFEAVNLLRLAKNKKDIEEGDYAKLKESVFEKGKDVRQLKNDLGLLVRERKELGPEEAEKVKKVTTVKRLIGTLKSLKQEAEISKLLPYALIQETAKLITKLEQEIS